MIKKQQPTKMLSPELYIRQKARTLPIGDCYITSDWQKKGIALVLVTRCHIKGTYTLGFFQVDTFCRGVIDCDYRFSVDSSSYKDIIQHFLQLENLAKVNYEEAHNLIYGAVAFAEEGGIKPASAFGLVQYILEEDTDEVPLIDYEFGMNGQHLLVANDYLELTTYYSQLKKALGDDFLYVLPDMKEPRRASEYVPSEMKETLDHVWEQLSQTPNVPEETYSYQHPNYPSEPVVKNQWLLQVLYNSDYTDCLPVEQIRRILELPHDELRTDLEQIMLFETGCTCNEISSERWEKMNNSVLIHCILLLGELGYPDSLMAVLETLRQNSSYYDYHFGDYLEEVYVPTLYLLGKNRLGDLMSYMQTPGLYTYARLCVTSAVAQIVFRQPERREEVIEWFRQLLMFYDGKLEERFCCDGTLIGLIAATLMDIHAVELLPELKVLFDTGLVDEGCAGNYQEVESEIGIGNYPNKIYPLAIDERYEELVK